MSVSLLVLVYMLNVYFVPTLDIVDYIGKMSTWYYIVYLDGDSYTQGN